jgi:hypothetical protein
VNGSASRAQAALRGMPLGALLVAALALFALGTTFPWYLGVALAVGGVAIATWIRVRFVGGARELAVVAILAVLVALASRAAATSGPILLGGFASLVLLLWIADDPREAPGGVRRAAPSVLVAGFVVAIAWGSALVLPSRNAVVGIAAGLFVFAVVVLAIFFGRPDLLERNRSENP